VLFAGGQQDEPSNWACELNVGKAPYCASGSEIAVQIISRLRAESYRRVAGAQDGRDALQMSLNV